MKFKPWVKYTFWIVFSVSTVLIMSFSSRSQNETVSGMPEIEIEVFKDMLFLTRDDLNQRLLDRGLIGPEMQYSQVELDKIEDVIREMPEVKNVQVYAYIGGAWKIELALREPIARIFNIDGSSCYLDRDGTLMPLSDNYTAHVLTVSGNINETDYTKTVDDIINNDSLKTNEILDDLYDISSYVCLDEFLSAQITHIHINGYNEFELIPRVGDQRILFGDADMIAGKFKKLEVFYTEGMSRAGWENYDTINIMCEGQVFCSKR